MKTGLPDNDGNERELPEDIGSRSILEHSQQKFDETDFFLEEKELSDDTNDFSDSEPLLEIQDEFTANQVCDTENVAESDLSDADESNIKDINAKNVDLDNLSLTKADLDNSSLKGNSKSIVDSKDSMNKNSFKKWFKKIPQKGDVISDMSNSDIPSQNLRVGSIDSNVSEADVFQSMDSESPGVNTGAEEAIKILSSDASDDCSSAEAPEKIDSLGKLSTDDQEESFGNICEDMSKTDSSESDEIDINNHNDKSGVNEVSVRYLTRLVTVLTIVCMVIAGLLATVNAVTRDKISENAEKAKTKAALSIFNSGTACELYTANEFGEIYLVYRESDVIGYCVFTTASGFGGDIEMMVGIDSEYKTSGVSIVSMSETPGVGSKATVPDFLNKFIGGSHNSPEANVDAVSGATISSNAIKDGVKKAHSIEVDLEEAAASRNSKVVLPEENISAVLKPDGEVENTGATDETEDKDYTEPETDAEEDIPFVENRPTSNYNYYVYATEVDPVCRIEVKKGEETAEIEEETETESDEAEPSITEPKEPDPVEIIMQTEADPEPVETKKETEEVTTERTQEPETTVKEPEPVPTETPATTEPEPTESIKETENPQTDTDYTEN